MMFGIVRCALRYRPCKTQRNLSQSKVKVCSGRVKVRERLGVVDVKLNLLSLRLIGFFYLGMLEDILHQLAQEV